MSDPTLQEATPLSAARYSARINFVCELAARLHTYGTTAQRLEGAITSVADKLGLECEPWANPTGLILSFSDPQRPAGESDVTRVIRLPPGENDLARLGETDRIAEAVLAGQMGLAEAHVAMAVLDEPPGTRARLLQILGYGMCAAAVAGLLRLPWLEIALAGANGLLIGCLVQLADLRPRLKEGVDVIAALVATAVTVLVASFFIPLNQNTVIIASLIVLLPGMALTNAINELSSQHLVAGSARFAGAVTTILKLGIGTVVALYVASLAGLEPQVRALRPQPAWVEWCAVALAAGAFAILFRGHRRDYPVVMAAAAGGYLISRHVGLAMGSLAGIFVAALVITVAGNAYARWLQRPGAVIRVPGIIMLVPGSASLRSLLTLLQQQDVGAGHAAILAVLNIILALVAGLLIGNLLLPSRRNL
ncbi:threonine/serine exporter family protein [Marilutibacter alkalisoli]|uniref:Threonine/serine exporter family protein n=1 Tax=Marilutibacter alkalisoli TaxID=2591633 RepID=A0A514BUE0_9GAMM|nr:threonine/serine exporter family protein [Lysobacter alkalisoli]QDH71013.1 threonine/serine exporter family protein [Lysobacter alkalisoli]